MVCDLGSFDLDRFRAVDAGGAKFISRRLFGTGVLGSSGKPLNLVAHLRRQPAGLRDQAIRLGATARRCCRLVAIRAKLWKSHNRLAAHRDGAPALEVLAVVSAKLLGVLLQHGILVATAWQMAGRSLARTARALAEVVKQMLLALGDSVALEAALLKLRDGIEKLGGTTDRKKDPSHAQLIEDAELLDWRCP